MNSNLKGLLARAAENPWMVGTAAGGSIALAAVIGMNSGGGLIHKHGKVQRNPDEVKRKAWDAVIAAGTMSAGVGLARRAGLNLPAGMKGSKLFFASAFGFGALSHVLSDKDPIAGVGSMAAATAVGYIASTFAMKGLQSAGTFLRPAAARVGKSMAEHLTSAATSIGRSAEAERALSATVKLLKNFPLATHLSLAAGAVSIPIAHSIIHRALKRWRHKVDVYQLNNQTKAQLSNQAGDRSGTKDPQQKVRAVQPLTASLTFSGQVRPHYDHQRIREELV